MARAHVNAQAELVVARIAGQSPAMDHAANRIQLAVRSVASQYVDTGAYIDAFQVVTVPGLAGNGRLVNDRLVANDDPAALPQEYGYLRRFKGSRRVQYIPGRHIMARGLATVR